MLNLRFFLAAFPLASLPWLMGCQSLPTPAQEATLSAPASAGAAPPGDRLNGDGVPGLNVPNVANALATVQPAAPAGEPPSPSAASAALAPEQQPDLYHRLRVGMRLPALQGKALERQARERERYVRMTEHVARVFGRSRAYLFDIAQAVEREDMPLELALLPAIESAFDVQARSWASADGLWQFIAPTARRYGLQLHLFQDDRRNVREATRAALRYLKELAARYDGDYHLALAAYNTGEGNVDKAVARARAQGLAGRYDELRLAQETLDYVPRLMALAQLLAEAVDAGQIGRNGWPVLENTAYFVGVPIERDIDVQRAAELAGMRLDEFRALNPSHKRPVIVAAANTEVLVPKAREAAFREGMLNYRGPLASWTAVTVPKRSAVETLARQFGGTAEMLRQVNDIPQRHLVTAGSTLLVPRTGSAEDISAEVAANARLATSAAMQWVTVPSRKRDSWAQWAQHLGVSAQQLKTWNRKPGIAGRSGVQLLVPIEIAELRPQKMASLDPKPTGRTSTARPKVLVHSNIPRRQQS